MKDPKEGLFFHADGLEGPPADRDSDSGGKTNSSQAKQLAATLLEELAPVLKRDLEPIVADAVRREVQSTKDKRFQRHDDRLGSLEDTTQRLVRHLNSGATPEEAKERVEAEIETEHRNRQIDELLSQNQPKRDNPTPAGNSDEDWVDVEAKYLSALGKSANDPDIVAMRREAGSPEAWIEKLKNEAWDLATRPTGDEGDLAPKGEGPAPHEADLMTQFEEEMNELRRTAPGDARRLLELKQKYRKLGLSI